VCIYRYRPVWFVAPAGPFCFIRKLDCLVPILLLMPHSLFRKKGVCVSLLPICVLLWAAMSACVCAQHMRRMNGEGRSQQLGSKPNTCARRRPFTGPSLSSSSSFFIPYIYIYRTAAAVLCSLRDWLIWDRVVCGSANILVYIDIQ